eukprot:jgi/Pico_ML_1/54487/g4826.t1
MATKATKAQVLRGGRWNTKAGVRSRGIDRTKATWKRCFSVTFDEEVSSDAYLVLGKAHCFVKDPEGKLQDHYLIEPIGATSLECMRNGAKTSFEAVVGVRYGEAMKKDVSLLPEEFKGQVRKDFNVNFDDKRVVNMENIVTDDDNIKQDISIDVYGRQKEDEESEKEPVQATEAPTEEKEDDDDGVDSLLGL